MKSPSKKASDVILQVFLWIILDRFFCPLLVYDNKLV